ncbi:MAG: efflux transporter outer membrane subunit [Micavibrio sp.]|nr:efflux transporter outer membrane subunit [Micavibrio sp.]
MKTHRVFLYLLPIFIVTACSTHSPRQTEPTVLPPDIYSVDHAGEAIKIDTPWWHIFDRPNLNILIEQAFAQNQDIAQAVANLKQAQALSRRTRADRLPQLGLQGNIAKEWERSDGQGSTRAIGTALSWEIDIFNRIGSAAKADRYETQARAQDVETVKLALSADIANAYFSTAASHQRLALLEGQLKLDRELQNLLQLRLDNGVGTNVDVLRQKARVADSQTLIPLAQGDLSVFENRLDVLLGQMPDSQMRVPPAETLNFDKSLPPLGVPAALLLNRPDLKALHAELIAADAGIASAIADRLPRITLDGSYAYVDTASYSGPLATIMGAFVQPLLDWGKRKAEVERNEALYEGKLAEYTQTYLEAVEDVENSLVREKKQREFLRRLSNQISVLKQTVDASENRYKQGIDDYLPVIDALQELRQVERSMITEQLELVRIRISLYRAIGAPIYDPIIESSQDEN